MDIETFTTRCEQATTPDALWDLAVAYFTSHGVPRIKYLHLPPPGGAGTMGARLRSSGFPEAWVRRYLGERLYRVDPMAVFSRQSGEPFFWSDISRLKTITPAEQAYLDALERADLGEGLGIQVFGPGGRNGFCALGLDPEAPHPTGLQIRGFQWACQLAHLRGCALLAAGAAPLPQLTDRERDILEWVARGKSNAVIATLLGISPHTVDTYMRRLYEKLDVTDRVSATLRGLGYGLIGNDP
jgi:LuxR family transcriptional regulator/LuxR family quorum-sensing system transcriptional regulator CciR